MTTRTLVMLSAALEGATGVAFIEVPDIVATVLVGTGTRDVDIMIIRLTGIILFSLGVAWWPSEEIVTPQAFATLFTYNLFAAFYFGYLRVGRGFVSHLLWPACPLHALLALLLARPAYESVRSQWLGSWFPEVKRQTASEIVLGLKKNPETTSKETQANSQLEKTEKHSTKETKL